VEIFDRMTAVDPEDRYPSMAWLARALESCRRGLTAQERGLQIVRPARDVDQGAYDSTLFTRSFETHSGRSLDDSLTDSDPVPGRAGPLGRRGLVWVAWVLLAVITVITVITVGQLWGLFE